MTTQHTPGPWHRNIKPVTRYPVVFAGRNTHVASVCSGAGMPPDEAEANCALIIAAPAMLEALRDLLEWAEDTGGWEAPAWQRARKLADALDGIEPEPAECTT